MRYAAWAEKDAQQANWRPHGTGQKEEAEAVKAQVAAIGTELEEKQQLETELEGKIREAMMKIPNFIDPSVPIGRNDSENVEVERFGEPVVPDFPIPYHVDIMEKLHGIDLMLQERPAATASIICAEILHGCTPPFWHMQEIS